ncbi:MAG: Uma2 family endonuclease [Gemmataceae bacterium]|nr:Uma2 family endonuclease [Gemmataceae bacterium]MCI0740310.1 Uma2 family endonuclease [Gemmataceae bacterium]
MSSPQKKPHGKWQFTLIQWLATYEMHTPVVEGHTGTTVVLGDGSEVQPDGCLMFAHEASDHLSNNDDDYVMGAPELIAEIASSTESIDLHGLKDDYEKAGVREYIVVTLRKKRVFWFRLQRGKFKEVKPGPDGFLRSVVFPGLWLDPDALVRRDRKRLLQVLHEGLASAEHAAFVAKLEKRRK